MRKLKQKNNYSVGMYYFVEGVTVKVLNSYTENIESSGWFGRFIKKCQAASFKDAAWHLTLSNFYGFFGTPFGIIFFAAYNFVGADPYIIFFL